MANKHSLLDSDYMIQIKTESGTQTSYNNIKLMDAERSYFITADEIVRCLCETLCQQSTPPSSELSAENIMIASVDEVKDIAPTVKK